MSKDKMSDLEFADKCDWEGVEYAVTEYGLSIDHLEEGSVFFPVMKRIEELKEFRKEWVKTLEQLEHMVSEVVYDNE